MERVLAYTINVNSRNQEKVDANNYFYEKLPVENVAMCVDGTHIRIITKPLLTITFVKDFIV